MVHLVDCPNVSTSVVKPKPEPGAVEPSYFTGAGAVTFVENGSRLAKNRDLKKKNLVTLLCRVQTPLLSFSSSFYQK